MLAILSVDSLRVHHPGSVFGRNMVVHVGFWPPQSRKDLQNEWINNRETGIISITFVVDKDGYLAGASIYGDETGPWMIS